MGGATCSPAPGRTTRTRICPPNNGREVRVAWVTRFLLFLSVCHAGGGAQVTRGDGLPFLQPGHLPWSRDPARRETACPVPRRGQRPRPARAARPPPGAPSVLRFLPAVAATGSARGAAGLAQVQRLLRGGRATPRAPCPVPCVPSTKMQFVSIILSITFTQPAVTALCKAIGCSPGH